MKLDLAIEGITALGFDTAPLIYFVERHTNYLDLMRAIIQRVDSGKVAGYSSVVTLTEVLTQPMRLNNSVLETEYRELLLNSRNFALAVITTQVAERAAGLRAKYSLRTPDALQIAAALETGCQAFLTNDLELKRVTELQVLVLAEIEL
jgi:predicted nucleic acid-binding protein